MTEHGDRFRAILENRSEVLRALTADPDTKPALADSLDTSRSTIDRAIRDLESAECITRTDDGYVATTTGRLALAEYDRYCRRNGAIQGAYEFLNSLHPDAPVDPAILLDATISMPEEHAPDQALKPSIDLVKRSTSIRGLAPAVLSFYPDLLEQRVREADATIEIIAAEDVLAVLPNLMSERVSEFLEHDNVSLYHADGDLPYALWLMGTDDGIHTGITSYDSNGVAGVLLNDTDDAVEWATAEYERYLDSAELISTSSL